MRHALIATAVGSKAGKATWLFSSPASGEAVGRYSSGNLPKRASAGLL